MKTAVDKNETHFERMKRQSHEWLEKRPTAPPFLHLALNQFMPSDCQRSELTDEEIEKESEIEIPQSSTSTLNVQRMRWIQGAQWARDRQKGGKP